MRKTLLGFGVGMALCVTRLAGEVVTLPAAASIVGGSPFYSDVRVFNTSYASPLTVTAVYRCFIATVACPAVAPQIQFTLAPRESKAFNDICANAFGAPNTAGGVEFTFTGDEEQLVVTSRLYSTSPLDSVGMFIPGLDGSKAHAATVLTSIRHDPAANPPAGFRTNVGVFNPGSSATTVTFTITDNGAAVGVPVLRSVSGHSGVQVSGIFEAAGAAGLSAQNVEIVVESAVPLFSYAAVLDNRTADPIFVVGAPNLSGSVTPGDTDTPTATPPAQISTKTRTPTMQGPAPTNTRTPTVGGPSPTRTSTRTPTVPGPSRTPTPTVANPTATNTSTPPVGATNTPTPTPPAATSTRTETATRTATPTNLPNQVNIGPGLSFSPSTITINAGDTVNWVWKGSNHSTTSGTCAVTCTPDGLWDSGVQSVGHVFSRQFLTQGTFTYFCKIHGAMMTGTVKVN